MTEIKKTYEEEKEEVKVLERLFKDFFPDDFNKFMKFEKRKKIIAIDFVNLLNEKLNGDKTLMYLEVLYLKDIFEHIDPELKHAFDFAEGKVENRKVSDLIDKYKKLERERQ